MTQGSHGEAPTWGTSLLIWITQKYRSVSIREGLLTCSLD
jgi:hypothetical protein